MTQLSRTNCEEAFRLLNDFLDRRLTPEETQDHRGAPRDLRLVRPGVQLRDQRAARLEAEGPAARGARRAGIQNSFEAPSGRRQALAHRHCSERLDLPWPDSDSRQKVFR